MAKVALKQFRVEKIQYQNKMPAKQQVQIQTSTSFQIKYAPQEKTCLGRSVLMLRPTNVGLDYVLEIELVSFFTYDPDDDRREVHVAVARAMHDYMNELAGAMMKSAGGPVIKLPEFTMTVDDVKSDQGNG